MFKPFVMIQPLNISFSSNNQKNFNENPKTHKMIHVLCDASGTELFMVDQLVDLIDSLPGCFDCLKCTLKDSTMWRFKLSCSICNELIFIVSTNTKNLVSTVIFSTKCYHICLKEKQRIGTQILYSVFTVSNVFDQTKNRTHPYRVIGKMLYKNSFCSNLIKKSLESKIFSPSQLRKIIDAKNNNDNLNNFLNSIGGLVQIRLYNKLFNSNKLLIYNDACIQSLSWIAPWCIDILKFAINTKCSYFQIDASFLALDPYVYCTPIIIIQNASLPLGLVLGPSEHQNLFLDFFNFLELFFANYNIFPVLSDQGSAIITFCKIKNIKQFFCYRHILEKFGSQSILAIYARMLLFTTKIEIYEKKLDQVLSDVNLLIQNHVISEKQIHKFIDHFNLKYENGILLRNEIIDFESSLWNRAMLGISTCSNHIERFHRTLNERTSKNQNILRRLSNVVNVIKEHYSTFPQRSRIQAKKTLIKLKKTAIKKRFNSDKCDCGWDFVYSNRFGIEGFPCEHTALSSNPNISDLIIPFNMNMDETKIYVAEFISGWDFAKKKEIIDNKEKKKKILGGECLDEENVFLLETANIVFVFGCMYSRKEILIEVSKLWTIKTILSPKECKENVQFRSKFRYEIFEKLIGDKLKPYK